MKTKLRNNLVSEAASAFGRKGGLAVFKDRKHMCEIGKKGSNARWKKIKNKE